MEKELLLVEELENSLIREGIYYMGKIENDWESNKFDPTYFDTYITGSLYTEFLSLIYERIKPLNNQEISRFLTLSVAQFKTHTPNSRQKDFVLNYWNTYWFPNEMGVIANEHEEKYAKHILKHYANHFNLFKEAAEKALEDFRAGLIGAQPSPIKVNDINIKNITYQTFDEFINLIKFDNEYLENSILYRTVIERNVIILKQEILENLINLSKDDRKPYLKRLLYLIEINKPNTSRTEEDITYWLEKYNIKSESDLYYNTSGDKLNKILSSIHIADSKDEEKINYALEIWEMKLAFYDIYWFRNVSKIVEFINEQINEFDPNPVIRAVQEQKPITPKLKTNLTVTELAFLFKMLNELKPDIFRMESDAELFRFISANIETKKSGEDGISIQKLRNLFSAPDIKAVKFWEKHFHTFIAQIKNYK